MSLSLADYDAALKENYSDNKLHDMVIDRHPLLKLLPKQGRWEGSTYELIFQLADPHGGSGAANFAAIKSAVSNIVTAKMQVTSTQHYNTFGVDSEAWYASKSNAGAVAPALDRSLKSAARDMGINLAQQIFGSSAGPSAEIASVSGGVIVFKNKKDALMFGLNQTISAATTAAGTPLRSGNGVVSAVSFDDGSITYTGTITSIQAGDFIFRANQTGYALSGLAAWMPAAATTLFGVNQAIYPQCKGHYQVISAGEIEEAFIDGVKDCEDFGGMTDIIVTDSSTCTKLMKTLAADRRYSPNDEMAKLGFASIQMANGVKVVSDNACPVGEAHLLDLQTWKLLFRGDELVHFVDDDGKILDKAGTDGVEGRVRSYSQVICTEPMFNKRLVGLNNL